MKAIGILCLGFLLAACQATTAKSADQCSSPLTYQDQSFSLNGSYGLIGLGGEYRSTSNIQNVEKQVQIYFSEAQFLCEQNQLGNLTAEEYIKERKELGQAFAEVVPALKATVSAENQKPTLDIQSLWLFSERNNIRFKESDTLDNVMDTPCSTTEVCQFSVVPIEKSWEETLLNCSFSALNDLSSTISTKIEATDQLFIDPKTKQKLKSKHTSTHHSTITSTDTKLAFAQQTELVQIEDYVKDRQTTEIRIKETLNVPAQIFGSNQPLIRVSSGFQNDQKSFQSRSGWLAKPELINDKTLSTYLIHLKNSQLPIKRISLVKEGLACQIVTNISQSSY